MTDALNKRNDILAQEIQKKYVEIRSLKQEIEENKVRMYETCKHEWRQDVFDEGRNDTFYCKQCKLVFKRSLL